MNWTIGIDFGLKHWGLARGIYGVIEPLGVIDAQGGMPNWDKLHTLVKPWFSGTWVIGYPRASDGSLLPPARTLKRHWPYLVKNLTGSLIPIDEFYTTKEAEDILQRPTRVDRKVKNRIDCLSACLILERYYDTLAIQPTSPETIPPHD